MESYELQSDTVMIAGLGIRQFGFLFVEEVGTKKLF